MEMLFACPYFLRRQDNCGRSEGMGRGAGLATAAILGYCWCGSDKRATDRCANEWLPMWRVCPIAFATSVRRLALHFYIFVFGNRLICAAMYE